MKSQRFKTLELHPSLREGNDSRRLALNAMKPNSEAKCWASRTQPNLRAHLDFG
jgi:hypothetical protein